MTNIDRYKQGRLVCSKYHTCSSKCYTENRPKLICLQHNLEVMTADTGIVIIDNLATSITIHYVHHSCSTSHALAIVVACVAITLVHQHFTQKTWTHDMTMELNMGVFENQAVVEPCQFWYGRVVEGLHKMQL